MKKFEVNGIQVEMSKEYYNNFVIVDENLELEIENILDDFDVSDDVARLVVEVGSVTIITKWIQN